MNPGSTRVGLGVPEGAQFLALLYSFPARTIVVHAQVATEPFHILRLFGKKIEARAYEQLVSASEAETIDDPLVCPVTTSLYFTVRVLERQRGKYAVMKEGQKPEWREGETTGGWIKGVYRKDLETGLVTPVIEYEVRRQLDVWVSSLHGVAPDGKAIICSAAFVESTPSSEREASYHLCELAVEKGTLRKCAPLAATFY